ncbi:MAG: winged helix DNA-binding protein [Alphaproteobacteria bacterium]|nr:MAG: winged helix DNA-binding protein [Alphaproteobacteria bacterium]
MKQTYINIIANIEKLHRLSLEVIKAYLDRQNIHDINNVQCFILYNIGEARLTVGEISNRGYYMGSNVTYNLKKMIESGYIDQEQSDHDRRSSHVKLSPKGMAFYKNFEKLFELHIKNLATNGVTEESLKNLLKNLHKLEAFWGFMVMHDIHH